MSTKAGYQPIDPANLEALPAAEAERAREMLKAWGKGGRRSASMFILLESMNAKGALIRNTEGPAWFGREGEGYEGV